MLQLFQTEQIDDKKLLNHLTQWWVCTLTLPTWNYVNFFVNFGWLIFQYGLNLLMKNETSVGEVGYVTLGILKMK